MHPWQDATGDTTQVSSLFSRTGVRPRCTFNHHVHDQTNRTRVLISAPNEDLGVNTREYSRVRVFPNVGHPQNLSLLME